MIAEPLASIAIASNLTGEAMFVEQSEHRREALRGLSTQIACILTCAYGFLLPYGLGLEWVFALTLSLVVRTVSALSETMQYRLDRQSELAWRHELVLRFGLDQLVAGARFIDWGTADGDAVEDIKTAKSNSQIRDVLSKGTLIDLTFWLLRLPIEMLTAPFLGFGLARLIEAYWPRLALFLTAGYRL